ncbi:hypothetical protein AVEN_195316-1 [Araneus ventricosus]|uniref:Uncharacterized protein n=1 Tax=Araneus ventricosus TaxID=182803 RepID=A0A4Y2IBU5_ARAVE|nr:hypothetical protein AVEN_195316-1 [Araneus ventricosus]
MKVVEYLKQYQFNSEGAIYRFKNLWNSAVANGAKWFLFLKNQIPGRVTLKHSEQINQSWVAIELFQGLLKRLAASSELPTEQVLLLVFNRSHIAGNKCTTTRVTAWNDYKCCKLVPMLYRL